MALTPGTRLGVYEILSPAGSGGMGEVYKARDTRLDRSVAIKTLPSADPDLRARFERDANAIASLLGVGSRATRRLRSRSKRSRIE